MSSERLPSLSLNSQLRCPLGLYYWSHCYLTTTNSVWTLCPFSLRLDRGCVKRISITLPWIPHNFPSALYPEDASAIPMKPPSRDFTGWLAICKVASHSLWKHCTKNINLLLPVSEATSEHRSGLVRSQLEWWRCAQWTKNSRDWVFNPALLLSVCGFGANCFSLIAFQKTSYSTRNLPLETARNVKKYIWHI